MRTGRMLMVSAGAWLGATLAAGLIACSSSSSPPKDSGESMPTQEITAVMNAHTDELLAISGVTGVAIGALDNGTPCILVLVLKDTDELRKKIPKSLEGHPIKIFESGEIKPMDGH